MTAHLQQFVVMLPLVVYRPHWKRVEIVERNLKQEWSKSFMLVLLKYFDDESNTLFHPLILAVIEVPEISDLEDTWKASKNNMRHGNNPS